MRAVRGIPTQAHCKNVPIVTFSANDIALLKIKVPKGSFCSDVRRIVLGSSKNFSVNSFERNKYEHS